MAPTTPVSTPTPSRYNLRRRDPPSTPSQQPPPSPTSSRASLPPRRSARRRALKPVVREPSESASRREGLRRSERVRTAKQSGPPTHSTESRKTSRKGTLQEDESESCVTEAVKTLANLEKWRKTELIVECRRRGLKVTGLKRDLRERIEKNVRLEQVVGKIFPGEEVMNLPEEHQPHEHEKDKDKQIQTRRAKANLNPSSHLHQNVVKKGRVREEKGHSPHRAVVEMNSAAARAEGRVNIPDKNHKKQNHQTEQPEKSELAESISVDDVPAVGKDDTDPEEKITAESPAESLPVADEHVKEQNHHHRGETEPHTKKEIQDSDTLSLPLAEEEKEHQVLKNDAQGVKHPVDECETESLPIVEEENEKGTMKMEEKRTDDKQESDTESLPVVEPRIPEEKAAESAPLVETEQLKEDVKERDTGERIDDQRGNVAEKGSDVKENESKQKKDQERQDVVEKLNDGSVVVKLFQEDQGPKNLIATSGDDAQTGNDEKDVESVKVEGVSVDLAVKENVVENPQAVQKPESNVKDPEVAPKEDEKKAQIAVKVSQVVDVSDCQEESIGVQNKTVEEDHGVERKGNKVGSSAMREKEISVDVGCGNMFDSLAHDVVSLRDNEMDDNGDNSELSRGDQSGTEKGIADTMDLDCSYLQTDNDGLGELNEENEKVDAQVEKDLNHQSQSVLKQGVNETMSIPMSSTEHKRVSRDSIQVKPSPSQSMSDGYFSESPLPSPTLFKPLEIELGTGKVAKPEVDEGFASMQKQQADIGDMEEAKEPEKQVVDAEASVASLQNDEKESDAEEEMAECTGVDMVEEDENHEKDLNIAEGIDQYLKDVKDADEDPAERELAIEVEEDGRADDSDEDSQEIDGLQESKEKSPEVDGSPESELDDDPMEISPVRPVTHDNRVEVEQANESVELVESSEGSEEDDAASPGYTGNKENAIVASKSSSEEDSMEGSGSETSSGSAEVEFVPAIDIKPQTDNELPVAIENSGEIINVDGDAENSERKEDVAVTESLAGQHVSDAKPNGVSPDVGEIRKVEAPEIREDSLQPQKEKHLQAIEKARIEQAEEITKQEGSMRSGVSGKIEQSRQHYQTSAIAADEVASDSLGAFRGVKAISQPLTADMQQSMWESGQKFEHSRMPPPSRGALKRRHDMQVSEIRRGDAQIGEKASGVKDTSPIQQRPVKRQKHSEMWVLAPGVPSAVKILSGVKSVPEARSKPRRFGPNVNRYLDFAEEAAPKSNSVLDRLSAIQARHNTQRFAPFRDTLETSQAPDIDRLVELHPVEVKPTESFRMGSTVVNGRRVNEHRRRREAAIRSMGVKGRLNVGNLGIRTRQRVRKLYDKIDEWNTQPSPFERGGVGELGEKTKRSSSEFEMNGDVTSSPKKRRR